MKGIRYMKRITLLAACAAASLVTAFAGPPDVQMTQPEPTCFGPAWYMGFQAGVNAFQDFGGTRTFEVGGDVLEIDPHENMGFVGGFKLGYVFGNGVVRPAIEADVFYNGIKGDLDARVNGQDVDFNADADLNSGAFL